MNFAPYQDTDPSTTRALSPPPKSPPPTARSPPPARYVHSPPPPQHLPPPSAFDKPGNSSYNNSYTNIDDDDNSHASAPRQAPRWGNTNTSGAEAGNSLDMFGTSLPLRLDWEACLAYILLPPAGPALLLVLEHKSDYVRFHAWQSSLLFSALFVLHLLLSWNRVLSWMLFVVDVGAMVFLAWRAWRDASTLDRCEVPLFGRWASAFVDEE